MSVIGLVLSFLNGFLNQPQNRWDSEDACEVSSIF